MQNRILDGIYFIIIVQNIRIHFPCTQLFRQNPDIFLGILNMQSRTVITALDQVRNSHDNRILHLCNGINLCRNHILQMLLILPVLQYPPDAADQDLRHKRLCNEIHCTRLKTAGFRGGIAVCGQKYYRDILPAFFFPDSGKCLKSIHFRHIHIQQY